MVEQAAPLTRHDLEAKIIKRCWEDEAFHQEFISDPAAAFVKYLQVPAAGLPKITVHQEEPGTWHIVMPIKPVATGQLHEEDLEKISGGTTPACVISIIGVSVASAASVSSASYVISKEAGGW